MLSPSVLLQLKALLQERKVLDFSGQKKDLVARALASYEGGAASPSGTPDAAAAPSAKRTRSGKADSA
jgi:hypothetical protein